MKRLILAALVLFAAACSAPSPGKLGIVTPTERTVNFDPSQPDGGGLAAQVGFQVFSPLGDKSWVKYGSGNTQWALVASRNPVVFDSRDWNAGAVLNLMTTTTNYLMTPTLPGYYCIPLGGSGAVKFVATTGSGSTPVAPTGNYGNNGTTRTNWAPSASGTPVANTGFAAGLFPYTVNSSISAAPGIADLATPLGMDITVAATTATTWAGYFLTNCYLYKY